MYNKDTVILTFDDSAALVLENFNTIFEERFTDGKVKNDHRSKFSNLSNWKEEA